MVNSKGIGSGVLDILARMSKMQMLKAKVNINADVFDLKRRTANANGAITIKSCSKNMLNKVRPNQSATVVGYASGRYLIRTGSKASFKAIAAQVAMPILSAVIFPSSF